MNSGGCCGVESCLGLADEGGEAGGVVHCDVGENLAVEVDIRLLEAVDELRVADAVDLGGGIDTHDPERAVLTLLLLAAAVGELESALDGFLRCLVELRFGKEITAGALEDLFAAVVAFCSTFYAGHCVFSVLIASYWRLEAGAFAVTSSLACFPDHAFPSKLRKKGAMCGTLYRGPCISPCGVLTTHGAQYDQA